MSLTCHLRGRHGTCGTGLAVWHFATHHLWHTTFHTPLCHTHHLSHTISHPPSFTHSFVTPFLTHRFVTHHLLHTIFHHTIFHIQLCHTHTHHLSPHHLSHTTLSHTIFHTQLCHTLSFTHNCHTPHLSHTTLSYTPSFFVTHHLSHTTLSHTTFFLHVDPSTPPLSSLPRRATTFAAHYRKKLACGVIRSYNVGKARNWCQTPNLAWRRRKFQRKEPYRRGVLLRCMGGRANPLLDPIRWLML